MLDNTESDTGEDPGPIETGPVAKVAYNDPGPIDTGLEAEAAYHDPGHIALDAVMKRTAESPADLMAGRDLLSMAAAATTTTDRASATSDDDAGVAYAKLIADQLTEERNRKSSLEARGVTVITTSGTLATLLFALTAGLTAAASFKLPANAKLPLLLALIAFVIAAMTGLATNAPMLYREPTPQGLRTLVDARYWTAPARVGQERVAESQIVSLAAARVANNRKVQLLMVAISAELLAVIFLAWAVASILYSS